MRKLEPGDLYVTTLGSFERRWIAGQSAAEFHVTLSRDATWNKLTLITLRFNDAQFKLHTDTLRINDCPQLLQRGVSCYPVT